MNAGAMPGGGRPYEPPRTVTMTSAGSEIRGGGSGQDARSICLLVEPIWTPDGIAWHGMTIVGGRTVNDITGPAGAPRSVVLDDCLCALASEVSPSAVLP